MKDEIIELLGLRFDATQDRLEEASDEILKLLESKQVSDEELKIECLINDTYQVINSSDTVIFQGSISDCNAFLTKKLKA